MAVLVDAVVLNRTLIEAKQMYDSDSNGMSFTELVELSKLLGYKSHVSSSVPQSSTFLAGVMKLPLVKTTNSALDAALKHGSVKLEGDSFYYPIGHAIVVERGIGNDVTILDPLIGFPQKSTLSVVTKHPELPEEY